MIMVPTTPPGPTAGAGPVRVMLCDDSATVRAALARVLESDPEIKVVARVAAGMPASVSTA